MARVVRESSSRAGRWCCWRTKCGYRAVAALARQKRSPEMGNHWEMGGASGCLGRSDVDDGQVVLMDAMMGRGDGDGVGWKSMGRGVIARTGPVYSIWPHLQSCVVRCRLFSPQNAPLTPASSHLSRAKVIHPATVHASRSSKVRTSSRTSARYRHTTPLLAASLPRSLRSLPRHPKWAIASDLIAQSE